MSKSTNQVRAGIKVEKEHAGTLRFIKKYVKTHKRFPNPKTVYTHIAKDHLKEDKAYYTKLKKYHL